MERVNSQSCLEKSTSMAQQSAFIYWLFSVQKSDTARNVYELKPAILMAAPFPAMRADSQRRAGLVGERGRY